MNTSSIGALVISVYKKYGAMLFKGEFSASAAGSGFNEPHSLNFCNLALSPAADGEQHSLFCICKYPCALPLQHNLAKSRAY